MNLLNRRNLTERIKQGGESTGVATNMPWPRFVLSDANPDVVRNSSGR
ncbi:hypothetical protein XFF7767_850016 [Xanthomonas citri pv. fuscans]|nr:hypothetical protein XFF7767_850016 [Xanthomonas citri pv. fuscans]